MAVFENEYAEEITKQPVSINGSKCWYNKVASKYKGPEGSFNNEYYEHFYLKPFREWIDIKDKVILDVGCGTGKISRYLNPWSDKIIGIDYSFEMLSNTHGVDKGKFFNMDMNDIGFKDSSFDAATAMGSLEFLDNISSVFKEINRVLKPGGLFIFTIRNKLLYAKLYISLRNKFSNSDLKKEDFFITKSYTLDDVKYNLEQSGLYLSNWYSTYYLPIEIMQKIPLFHKATINWNNTLSRFILTKKLGAVFVIAAHKIN